MGYVSISFNIIFKNQCIHFLLSMSIVNEFPIGMLNNVDEEIAFGYFFFFFFHSSLDLFPNESRPILSKCYLECQAGTTLLAIERFLRIKYELESNLKVKFSTVEI